MDTCLYVPKPFLVKFGKLWVLPRHGCLLVPNGAAVSVALAAGISLVSILEAGDWDRVSMPARHYLSAYITTTNQHQDSIQKAVPGLKP